jgi:hypothetical protein
MIIAMPFQNDVVLELVLPGPCKRLPCSARSASKGRRLAGLHERLQRRCCALVVRRYSNFA